jgi:putative transposase
VNLTVQLQLIPEDKEELITRMKCFNEACNWLSEIAYREHIWYWLKLQNRAYYELRSKYKLTSAEAQAIPRKVASVYKNKNSRNILAKFNPLGAIPISQHTIYKDKRIRFYGLRMSYVAREGVELPKRPQVANLVFDGGRFYIQQALKTEVKEPYNPVGFIGCDMGIKNILVDSQNECYSSSRLNSLRNRYSKLNTRLQKKGTRSSVRLLKIRRKKESRLARDINHCVSKRVVAKANGQHLGIALEDLKGIRKKLDVGKAHRRQQSSWAFWQLRRYITYKAKLSGVPLVLVDPHNTSRECPNCGKVDKRNRKSQSEFQCISCGFGGIADIIAAGNIARRAADSQPYAHPIGIGANQPIYS